MWGVRWNYFTWRTEVVPWSLLLVHMNWTFGIDPCTSIASPNQPTNQPAKQRGWSEAQVYECHLWRPSYSGCILGRSPNTTLACVKKQNQKNIYCNTQNPYSRQQWIWPFILISENRIFVMKQYSWNCSWKSHQIYLSAQGTLGFCLLTLFGICHK